MFLFYIWVYQKKCERTNNIWVFWAEYSEAGISRRTGRLGAAIELLTQNFFSVTGNRQEERAQNAPCGRLDADFRGRQYKPCVWKNS